MADTWQLLLHFSRSSMLHHTLFGIGWITYRIGWITYRIGWIVARNRPKVRLLLLHFHQIWCSIFLSPLGDIQKKMWCIYLVDLLKKNWLYLRVFPPSGVIRGVFHIIYYSAHSVWRAVPEFKRIICLKSQFWVTLLITHASCDNWHVVVFPLSPELIILLNRAKAQVALAVAFLHFNGICIGSF